MRHASIFFLLLGMLLCPLPAAAQDGQLQAIPDPVLITGRIVDEQGKPVRGVEIAAITSAMGRTLYSAHTHGNATGDSDWHTASNQDGEFVLGVPFEGIRYTIGARFGSGYAIQEQSLIAVQDGEPLKLVAKPFKAMDPVGVLVNLPDGKPAANQLVTLVGEYGGRWVALTDDAGHALFDDLRVSHIGQAVLLIERDGLVAPLTIVRWREHGENPPTEVTLAEPGIIEGRVVTNDTGKPIAGATVVISPGYSSGLEWRVETDKDGQYRQAGLPPGRYQYRAVCDSHTDRPPRGHYWFEREVELAAGGTTDASDFQMIPRATLRGQVKGPDGKPVTGAIVGYPCHYGQGYDTTDAVFTDADGRFELRPAPERHIDMPLEAFHPIAGGVSLRLEPFRPGEVREEVEVVTTGTARLHGKVTDEAGKPIAGVACNYNGPGSVGARTDDQGRYDMGLVRLVPKKNGPPSLAPVHAMSPHRPGQGMIQHDGENWQQHQIDSEDKRYFIDRSAIPALGPNGEARQDFVLAETRLLTFRGVARNDDNKPITKARVYLLPRQIIASNENDRKAIEMFIKTRDAGHRWMTSGRIPGGWAGPGVSPFPDAIQELVVTTTDKTGAWAMQCLESDTSENLQKQLWLTVLLVWGEKEHKISHLLYPSVQIDPDQNVYTLPADKNEDEDE